MAGETPRPELERQSQEPLFNIAAMGNEQIAAIYHGLYELEVPTEVTNRTVNGLMRKLVSDARDAIPQNPERVKDLVRHCALSEEERDRELAARIAPGFVHYDYEFMRGALLQVMIDQERHDLVLDDASEEARYQVAILMRDHLTPEQATEINEQLVGYDHTMRPIEPAGTDSYWQG